MKSNILIFRDYFSTSISTLAYQNISYHIISHHPISPILYIFYSISVSSLLFFTPLLFTLLHSSSLCFSSPMIPFHLRGSDSNEHIASSRGVKTHIWNPSWLPESSPWKQYDKACSQISSTKKVRERDGGADRDRKRECPRI